MTSGGTNVRVAARCRPFNDSEKARAATRVVKMSAEKTVIHNPHPGTNTKEHAFSLDHSYFWDTKTEQIFHDLGTPLLKKAFEGFNVTMYAYGQTGTGKTHTMIGTEEEPGIIPLLNQGLFKFIDEAPPNKQFFITVSFYEIFQEMIHDLLNPTGQDLRVRQHPQLGIFIEGLAELVVQNNEDIARLFEQGNRVRKMASVDKNSGGTKSDCVFTIHVEQKSKRESNENGIRSKIVLIDMAGSERMEGVDLNIQSEGGHINKGISALNAVVSTLADPKKKEGHIPYRDSKLTRILQDSLGGSAYTAMITTVSPADSDYEETLAAMQCANRTKLIENAIKANEMENTKIIQDLRDEISRLREKLATTGRAGGANKDDVLQMEELIKDLQTAKRQTWEERERLSEHYDEERNITLANKGILDWVMDSTKRDNKEVQEKLMALQKEKDQLTAEFKEKRRLVDELKDDLQSKIADYSQMAESGRSSEEENKARVSAIHDLKEKLKSENEELKKIKHELKDVQEKQKAEKEEAKSQTTYLKGNAELRYRIESERREKHEKENAATLADEVDRVKMELEQEKAELQLKAAEGAQYSTDQAIKLEMELVEMKAERTVMSLRIQSVTEEKKRLKTDLEEAYKRHKEELEIQQLQHFQTFRNYREVFEDQKSAIEQRYRSLLEEAIQDAVFLSTRNQELMHENQALKQEIAELKDQVSLGGSKVDVS
ncbi:PREDICTED: kinesin-II 85 kDa subunit-like isoform X1 [Acropora digitifera]|uniref:kinesin-II 85 kDa subunit-like isoform X1 n=1 Tax=Acropora digitifera TaxID=70779 RepID=UPI00077A183C|nr:PREDICTED: kinesin-II 85 kDa subunit-like isoform X1 [Acropora digitifera]